MSWLPMYNAWVVFIAILSLFLWKLLGVLLFLMVAAGSAVYLLKEVLVCKSRFMFAFWLFIFSEVAAFGSLFWVCFWSSEVEVEHISDCFELPFLGCFLLMGSSMTVSAYHHGIGIVPGNLCLYATVLLGSGFVGLQIWELHDCECDLLKSVYHAVSFCTVGLHFSHVLMGLIGLSVMIYLGHEMLGRYHINLVVWYWHFVDYIWLFVFSMIYIA